MVDGKNSQYNNNVNYGMAQPAQGTQYGQPMGFVGGAQPQMMMQQQQMPMVMMSQELMQAKQDYHDLKELKEHDDPKTVFCPMCEHRGHTEVKSKKSQVQYLACMGCVCIGCWLGCCVIPFCVSAIGDHVHYCGKCNHPLGKKGIKLC